MPTLIFPWKKLHSILHEHRFSIGSPRGKVALSGVLFESNGSVLNVVSTNGLLLVHRQLMTPESWHPVKAIIQGNNLKHFKGFLKSMKKNGQLTSPNDEVSLVFTDNTVYLNCGSEFSTESPLLQEEYPDYTRVIPKELDFYILLQVSELRAIVDIADDITTIANRRMSTDLLKDVLKVFNTTTLTLAFYKDDTNVVISTNESPGMIALVPSREA